MRFLSQTEPGARAQAAAFGKIFRFQQFLRKNGAISENKSEVATGNFYRSVHLVQEKMNKIYGLGPLRVGCPEKCRSVVR